MRKTYKINSVSLVASIIMIIGLIIGNSIIPHGSDNKDGIYSLNLNEGDLFAYQIISFNSTLSLEFLGSENITDILGNNAQIGSIIARKVISIEETDNIPTIFGNKSGWKCDFLIWYNWTNCLCHNNLTNAVSLSLYYLNHVEYITNNTDNIDYFLYSGFPTPLIAYINNLQLSNNFTIEGNQITKDAIEQKQVQYIYTFNSTDGYLSEYSCSTSESETIWSIKRL